MYHGLIGGTYHCDSGYPLDPALVPKGMRVYPWPNRRSASRGRWEHAEAGADNLSFCQLLRFHLTEFSLFHLHVDMKFISATKQVESDSS